MADQPTAHGPCRTALESLKQFAEAWGFPTLESAADLLDQVTARTEAKKAMAGRVVSPGPTRTQ